MKCQTELKNIYLCDAKVGLRTVTISAKYISHISHRDLCVCVSMCAHMRTILPFYLNKYLWKNAG